MAVRLECSGCGRSLHAENVSRKTATALGFCRRSPPSGGRGNDRIVRTREAGKSHLWSQLRGETGADAPDAAQAVQRAKRAEGVAVRYDSRRERRTDAVQRLHELGGRGVHVHAHGRSPGGLPRGSGAPGAARPPLCPGGVDQPQLIAKGRGGSRIICLLAAGADDADTGAEGDDCGEEEQSFALGGRGHTKPLAARSRVGAIVRFTQEQSSCGLSTARKHQRSGYVTDFL